ncbi:MAG: 3TM-type holin [Planctomycetota bacterium]|jgi:hypothetical protein
MSFLSFIPVIGKIIDKGLGIIDKTVLDKDEAAKLKAAIRTQILVNDHDEVVSLLEAQSKIILAEAQGGWLQRNWRPALMVIVMLIVANNYIFVPYASMFTDKIAVLELPGGLWALLNIGVGGYVAGRSAEKILRKNS